MKRRSSKQAALYREWTPIRLDWLWANPVCCRCGGAACDVHEILAGSHRMNAFVERCCWLRVCRLCHDVLQGTPIVEQMALKLLTDPEGYDLGRTLEVWGRAPTAITPGEVLDEVRKLLIWRMAA